MELGVFVNLVENMEEAFAKVKSYGFSNCQLSCWNLRLMNADFAPRVKAAAEKYGVTISACWCGWSGQKCWTLDEGPLTLGIVPLRFREMRIRELKKGMDFAKELGVTDVITHVGYFPEVVSSTEYKDMVIAIKDLAEYALKNNQYFLFETGQETPITLKRVIDEVATGNLGINLDPSNLITSGKGNPIDALTVFGQHVRGVHAKDGCIPTNEYRNGGIQVRVGEGDVNFPVFLKRLKEVGYDGPLTIECEVTGSTDHDGDLLHAKAYLEKLLQII